MTRSATHAGTAAALGLLSGILLFAAQNPPEQRPPVFRGGTNFVTVDVYPQRGGQIVSDLAAADFEVLEDGKPQKVETFEFVRVEPALSDTARRDPNTQREGNQLAADPRNRVFVVYLDAYHVDVAGSHATRQPLISALNRLLAPEDLFSVMTPKMRPSDLTFWRKTLGIEEQLARYWIWGERFSIMREPEEDALAQCFGQERMVEDGPVKRRLIDVLIARRREDLTLTSLEGLLVRLAGIREARTAVLVFTDGWLLYEPSQSLVNYSSPTQPGVYIGPGGRITGRDQANLVGDPAGCTSELLRLANLDDRRRMRDIIADANRNNIAFYPVNPGGLAVFDEPLSVKTQLNANARPGESALGQQFDRVRDRTEGLRTLAENTDGLAVLGTNDLNAGLRRIVDDMSAYYLLGYYSTNTRFDGGYRRIEVKVKRQGVNVKARRGYLAPNDTRMPAGAVAVKPAAVAPAITDALSTLARLRPTSELFTYGVARDDGLAIVAEIASAQIESGKWGQGGEVQAVVTGADGAAVGTAKGRIEPSARGVLLQMPLASRGTGPWRVSVKVTAGSESLDDRIEVSAASTTRVLGPPIVFRATPAARSPLRPVADFQFRRTERAHVEWPIASAVKLDRREARILGRTGQPLAIAVNLTEREAAGAMSLAADVNLAPLAEGDYVIEVVVGSGADTETTFVAIRVVR